VPISQFVRGCVQKFPDSVDNEITTTNTRWEATQRIMAAKRTRLTHRLAMQLHLVAESCIICSSSSRRPVRKLLNTPSWLVLGLRIELVTFRIWSWNTKLTIRPSFSGHFFPKGGEHYLWNPSCFTVSDYIIENRRPRYHEWWNKKFEARRQG
jgi:hypothetical protein